MRIIHLTNNDFDGAGRAVLTLHQALNACGCDSQMLVYRKKSKVEKVVELVKGHPVKSVLNVFKYHWHYINLVIHRLRRKYYTLKCEPKTLINFNLPAVSFNRLRSYLKGADIICLHSVQDFLSARLIRRIYDVFKTPMVWTTMDIEPLTGGCHFNAGCEKFKEKCEECPQLGVQLRNDVIAKHWEEKRSMFADIPLTFVAPTSWSHEQCHKSLLSRNRRIEKILIGINDKEFMMGDKTQAREDLGLPLNKKIILYGCFNLNDPRKGGKHLLGALKLLMQRLSAEEKDNFALVTFGNANGFAADQIGCPWINLGLLDDNRKIVKAYQACDIFACPSIDDCGPMVINEAIMCGSRVIAFNRGVAPDFITSPQTGYLVDCYDEEDFSRGLYQTLFEFEEDVAKTDIKAAREKILPEKYAENYKNLFKELMV